LKANHQNLVDTLAKEEAALKQLQFAYNVQGSATWTEVRKQQSIRNTARRRVSESTRRQDALDADLPNLLAAGRAQAAAVGELQDKIKALAPAYAVQTQAVEQLERKVAFASKTEQQFTQAEEASRKAAQAGSAEMLRLAQTQEQEQKAAADA